MKSIQSKITVNEKEYTYFSLKKAEGEGLSLISKLPRSLKILLENILRKQSYQDNSVSWKDAKALNSWVKTCTSNHEISFYPARVLMQDFTGVPAVVDLAAMRDTIKDLGGKPESINPLIPVDLVIDHSMPPCQL